MKTQFHTLFLDRLIPRSDTQRVNDWLWLAADPWLWIQDIWVWKSEQPKEEQLQSGVRTPPELWGTALLPPQHVLSSPLHDDSDGLKGSLKFTCTSSSSSRREKPRLFWKKSSSQIGNMIKSAGAAEANVVTLIKPVLAYVTDQVRLWEQLMLTGPVARKWLSLFPPLVPVQEWGDYFILY